MINQTGVLIAGLAGMTASTTAAGLVAVARGLLPPVFGVTSSQDFDERPLSNLDGWVVGGWDHDARPLSEAVLEYGLLPPQLVTKLAKSLKKVSAWPAIAGPLDANARSGIRPCDVIGSLNEGAQRVRADIERFRAEHRCDQIVVVYLGSPPRLGQVSPDEELMNRPDDFAGVHCYLWGAILAGAHFVDFTPSDALEHKVFLELAQQCGIQLAGRDGSTGQTMLKLHIGELLRRRSLRLRAWYSTNILGNNDGRVLNMPEHRVVKIQDKTAGLARVLGYDDFDHVVDISFVPSHGDAKESWDVVECEGWLGSTLSLRMNWRGCDSLLAAPMVLDICRLIDQGARCGRVGLQEGLGFFFKNPIGSSDVRPSIMYERLLEWVDTNLAKR
jgi:myo-inositol-1-phosphate synthase